MAADTSMRRLLGRIEQAIGLDLSQRTVELERWLGTLGVPLSAAALDAFGERLGAPSSPQLAELTQRFTVSHTRFFRDTEQLAAVDAALTALGKPLLRIWVAGCATGEEAYTLALLCQGRGQRVEIVGSDINSRSLAVAQAGRYPREVLQAIDPKYHGELRQGGELGDLVELSAAIRSQVRFVEHNLLRSPLLPPAPELWDLILCRNVLIYLRPELAAEIVRRLGLALQPGGYLLVGVSEFHLGSPGLVPVRLGDRILLRRPPSPLPLPPPKALAPAAVLPPPLLPLPVPVPLPTPAPGAPGSSTSGRLAMRLLLGRLDAVLAEALPVLIRNPEQQPALFLAGVAYHLKGRHPEAAALLDRTLAHHPSCWPASYFLAITQEALGRPDAAQAAYRTLRQDLPPTPEAQALIDLLELQQWKNEALALARRRLAGSTDCLPVFRLRPDKDADQPLGTEEEDAQLAPSP